MKYLNHISNWIKIVFFTSVLGLFAAAGHAQTTENTLKAVYLEKFCRFITWPEESKINDPSSPFIITVAGDDEFYETLEQIYSIQKIKDKKVVLKRLERYNDIEGSHLLYLGNINDSDLNKMLELANIHNVLTISSSNGFAEKGVLINFYKEANKLRFEINEKAILQSSLKMSFYLMNSARIVNPEK